MASPTAEQLQLELCIVKEKLSARNETIGQLNNKVDLMEAELKALKQHQSTQVQQEKPQEVAQDGERASPEQQVKSRGRFAEAGGQEMGEQEMELDLYGQTPAWNSVEAQTGVWCCSRCGWELEGDEGVAECCGVHYQWEWGPEGPDGELNAAYDDLNEDQVEPRDTSPSPEPREPDSDDLPNPSLELGAPTPPQVDAPTNSFPYQAKQSSNTQAYDAKDAPYDPATSANASAEGSDDEMDDFPPPLARWEQYELESRGATLSMIETFHLRFDYSLGIIAWLDNCLMDEFASAAVVDGESWKVYLGREIHLKDDDLDGARYIFEVLDDSSNGYSPDGYSFTSFRARVPEGEAGLIVTCPAGSLKSIPEKPVRDDDADQDARKLLNGDAKKQWDEERAAEGVLQNEFLSDDGETEPEPATGDEDSEDEDDDMDGGGAVASHGGEEGGEAASAETGSEVEMKVEA
ncbi:hypothetical protein BCR35DRAFT_329609 [Leucosporidium creatinivorum]|uniref:DUF8191 domain-containing protein n=1 Tax=Leucosporidium creatinivorum TaxID=106004 RepID=A0A1Y2FYN0_9BASI|nr:hypothetical protein BCR35DRAFT_329609 [Leucosporidium creatinivorum]